MELLHAKVEETYRHKETGEIFKEVKVIMPSLDLFSKTK